MQWTPFQYVLYLLDGARSGKKRRTVLQGHARGWIDGGMDE